jgi:hypothetical protein
MRVVHEVVGKQALVLCVCTFEWIYRNTYDEMYIYTDVCLCICVFIYTCVHIHANVHVQLRGVYYKSVCMYQPLRARANKTE